MAGDGTVLLVLGVIFLAVLVRSTFGFGEALVAIPLLAFVLPVAIIAPLAVLLSITVASVALIQDWRKIHARSAWWLILPTLLGIPLGVMMLKGVAESVTKVILALVIIACSSYCLLSRRPFELNDDRFAWFFGFGAGVLGGAYGMNAPPLVIYGSLRRWSPEQFRATLQGYFLPASSVGMAYYWLNGLWVPTVTHYYLFSLPLVFAAIFLGRMINRRLNAGTFALYVHLGLIAIAAVLLFHSLRSTTKTSDLYEISSQSVNQLAGLAKSAHFSPSLPAGTRPANRASCAL